MIKQGEDGDNLYVVDQGSLKCFKKFSKDDKEPKYLKTYQPGESFGELALLYNAPRAASIQAETVSVCFALDRECFNHIVKDAAVRKREKYEEFLVKVDLLQTMDPYERIKIADALKPEVFKAGELIMKQVFFFCIFLGLLFFLLFFVFFVIFCFYIKIIMHREKPETSFISSKKVNAFAWKWWKQVADSLWGTFFVIFPLGEKEKEVMNYKAGDYFGELALLKDEPRAASIKAKVKIIFFYWKILFFLSFYQFF